MDDSLTREAQKIKELYPVGYARLEKELNECNLLLKPFWCLCAWSDLTYEVFSDNSLSISLYLNPKKTETIYIEILLEVDEEDNYFSTIEHFKEGHQLWTHAAIS